MGLLVEISIKTHVILLYIIWKDKYTVQEKDRIQDISEEEIEKGERRDVVF